MGHHLTKGATKESRLAILQQERQLAPVAISETDVKWHSVEASRRQFVMRRNKAGMPASPTHLKIPCMRLSRNKCPTLDARVPAPSGCFKNKAFCQISIPLSYRSVGSSEGLPWDLTSAHPIFAVIISNARWVPGRYFAP